MHLGAVVAQLVGKSSMNSRVSGLNRGFTWLHCGVIGQESETPWQHRDVLSSSCPTTLSPRGSTKYVVTIIALDKTDAFVSNTSADSKPPFPACT